MAGDPLNGGGLVVLNGVAFAPNGRLVALDTPQPGGNLFSLASGGAIFVRDLHHKVGEDQLNSGWRTSTRTSGLATTAIPPKDGLASGRRPPVGGPPRGPAHGDFANYASVSAYQSG